MRASASTRPSPESPILQEYRRAEAEYRRQMSLHLFHPAVADWFRGVVRGADAAADRGLAGDRARRVHADPRADGQRQDAHRVSVGDQPGDVCAVAASGGGCRILYISPLKALAVDVERNLRAPIAGIANRAAARGDAFHLPSVAVRTGDTPAAERARFQREPADLLITTPESLYLLLTSNAREALRSIDTVILDEIHALVPTKRGAHLALSLERLQALAAAPPQRIGLSATQRPLDEVARFLGGQATARPRPRPAGSPRAGAETRRTPKRRSTTSSAAGAPSRATATVTIVDTSQKKKLELTIEVPVEDMARIGEIQAIPSGPAAQGPVRTSIWSAIHPRLLELVQAHRSTLIFVNSRRIAERLAAALNELAGEPLVRAHHGSLARPQRIEIEDRLKAGQIRGLVATSSLELGIDMGAIDLVIQIEAPPSVASGMQRIGRSGHTIDQPSRGIVVPKYRGDLVACAAVARAMHDGADRVDPLSAQSARRPRAADRGDGGDGRLERGRALSDRPRGGAVRRAEPADLRRRARHAVGPLPVGRFRGPAAAPDMGSAEARSDRARGRAARGGDQRRHHPGPRPLRRVPRRRARPRRPRRRAGRGDGVREPRRRDVPPRRLVVADRGDHPRSGARVAGARPAREDAVLEGGFRGTPAGARPPHRRARARAAADAAGRRDPAPDVAARSRRAGGREPPALPGRPGGRDGIGARRPDDRDRAHARRARRLAHLRALAARRPHPRAVGHGGRRARPVGDRHRRRDDVDRRRVRRPLPRDRAAARPGLDAAGVGRGRGAGGPPARRHGALRGEVPRGGGARAAAAAAAAGRPHAALAAAEAGGGSAGRGRGLRIVPDDPRGLSRSAARRVRHPRARRDAAEDRGARDSAPSRWTRPRRRRSPRRCCSATSPTTFTTATRRWPNGARRRSRSTRRSCASCSGKPSSASCSTPTPWPASRRSSSSSSRATGPARPTACTTSCSIWAT